MGKPGRPRKYGALVPYSMMVSPELFERLEKTRSKYGFSRHEFLRYLLDIHDELEKAEEISNMTDYAQRKILEDAFSKAGLKICRKYVESFIDLRMLVVRIFKIIEKKFPGSPFDSIRKRILEILTKIEDLPPFEIFHADYFEKVGKRMVNIIVEKEVQDPALSEYVYRILVLFGEVYVEGLPWAFRISIDIFFIGEEMYGELKIESIPRRGVFYLLDKVVDEILWEVGAWRWEKGGRPAGDIQIPSWPSPSHQEVIAHVCDGLRV